VEKAVEGKANSLDVKKLFPIVHEVDDKTEKMQTTMQQLQKNIQGVETSFNNA
jgi:DNA anti-recombination protein RmuC